MEEKKAGGQKKIVILYKKHRRAAVKIFVILVAAVICFYGMCIFLSYKAADIFNTVVEKRELFPGTVTVERLSATPLGKVSFENLVWKDTEGRLLADIPAGSFKVSLWDVVWRRIGTTTVTEFTIDQGYIHLIFDDNMELLYVNDLSGKMGNGEKRGSGEKAALSKITGLKGNKKFNCHIRFRDVKIEAESPDRHFFIDNVDLRADIHTGGITKLDLSAGHFTGTVEAEELNLGGTLDFTKEIPQYNMYLSIKNCNPKSLDVGINIDNKASVYANIKGELPSPVIDGTLSMDNLNMPGLKFTNVKGGFHYQDGKLRAPQVKAEIFGGTMDASGQFDLDGKSYHADIAGQKLKGSVAAHDLMLRCEVDMELHMGEDRKNNTRYIYGSFYSGSGQYHFLPFNKISGSFEQDGQTLNFKDVIISFAMGDVTAEKFSIVHGKVHMGPIYVDNGGSRSRLL